MIQAVPQYAAVGERVHFQVHNLPKDVNAFSWYKLAYGGQILKIVEYIRTTNSVTWGPEHRGRESMFYDGSLRLQDVTEEDEGMYTLEILNKDFKIEKSFVKFYVKSK